MIVDFRNITHDFYGNFEHPVLVIKHPDGRIISTISNYFALKGTFRFNDVSEFTFTAPSFVNGIKNNGYDEISGYRLVQIEPFGDFILVNPTTSNDGKKETKDCTAYSLEYALNYKRAEIPAGTYNFYNPVDNTDTIMQMIVDIAPDWEIGTIDRELIGKWRTFDQTDDNLYSFMMNSLQESYNCLFLFDTKEKKINVISANKSATNLPIYLSYENLIKSVEVKELSDEIVTALSAYGSGDDVNIRSVNPNGTNTIYNLDYFISQNDLPEEVAEKWLAYKSHLELYSQVYSNLTVLRNEKYNDLITAQAKLDCLQVDYNALNDTYLTCSTEKPDTEQPQEEYEKELENLRQQLETKQEEITTQNSKVESLNTDLETIKNHLNEISKSCGLKNYFTTNELVILSPYFKHDSISEETFVISEYSTAILDSHSNVLAKENEGSISLAGSEIYASNIAEIYKADADGNYSAEIVDDESGDIVSNSFAPSYFNDGELDDEIKATVVDQLNENTKKKVYEFRGGIFTYSYTDLDKKKEIEISGDIVKVNFHYNTDDLNDDAPDNELAQKGFFIVDATLKNATHDGTLYPTMNISMQGKILNDTPNIGDSFLKFEIESAVFYNTASATEYQQRSVIQELYDYAEECLEKLAWPSYEFNVDSANMIFAKEFESFKDKLEFGCTVNLCLDNDGNVIIQPILVELQLDYDNATSFSITFSSKFKSSTSEFKLADLITEMSRTSHSLELNKADYQSYKDSKTGNQVETMANSSLDVARNTIVNSFNQGVEMNSNGLFLRKKLDNGLFDDEQIGLINRMIAFTDDNWKTVKIGIGKFEDKNLGTMWGVVAPNIVGTLIVGENLNIENTVMRGDGSTVIKQFKVDESGAWLNNSSLVFSQDKNPNDGSEGGRIFIDPKYGIGAGNERLFKLDGTDIKPSFIDEETGKLILDENILAETEDGKVPYLPINTQFFFDIRTGNAYFGGTINGAKILPGTVSGETIVNGTINEEKIDSVNAATITGDLISAINACIEKVDSGKINADLIQSGAVNAGSLIVENDSAKLAIVPEYGIVAGNSQLFEVDKETGEIVSPTFVNSDGQLIFDKKTGAPLNSSFYFDINTGESYFAGSINADLITSGTIDAKKINVKNLNADNITAGSISSKYMQAEVVSAINAYIANATIDDVKITTAAIDQLSASQAWVEGLLTAGEILTDTIHAATGKYTKDLVGVNILGDCIVANTLQADSLILRGADGLYRKLNVDALGEDVLVKIEEEAEKNGEIPSVHQGIDGTAIIAHSITATQVDVDTLFAQEITAKGTIRGGTFLQNRIGFKSDDGTVYSTGTYIGDKGIAFGDSLVYDVEINKLTLKADEIDLIGKVTFNDFDTDSSGFKIDDEGKTIIDGGRIEADTLTTGSLAVGVPLLDYLFATPETTITYLQKTDENGEPVFDESGNPIYEQQVDGNGNLVFDENGQPVYVVDKIIEDATTGVFTDLSDKINGKSNIKVDENGNPVYKQKTDGTGEPLFNEDGSPVMVQMIDDDGNLVYDTEGNPVMVQDTDGTGELLFDGTGNPIYVQATNADGSLLYDNNGNPIYEYEYETTSGIIDNVSTLTKDQELLNQELDEIVNDTLPSTRTELLEYIKKAIENTTGNFSEYRSLLQALDFHATTGLTIYGYEAQYVQFVDESGQLVYDENGEPVYVQETDDSGNPIYDEFGNPIYVVATKLEDVYEQKYNEALDEQIYQLSNKQQETAILNRSPYSVNINNKSFLIRNSNLDDPIVTSIVDSTMEISNATIKDELRMGDYIYKEITNNTTGIKTLNLFYAPIN